MSLKPNGLGVSSDLSQPGSRSNAKIVAFMVFVLLSVPAFIASDLSFVSVQAPLVLAVMVKRYRLLQIATWIGCCLTWLGSVGTVGYLGISSVRPEVFQGAVQFSIFLSAGIFVAGRWIQSTEHAVGIDVSIILHRILLFFGCGLLALRLSAGIPLFAGNEVRLENVLTSSPLMGVLLGSVVITAAFLKSPSSVLTTVLQVILVILTIGTASRLLVVAVLLGVATGYVGVLSSRFKLPSWTVGAIVSLACIAACVVVYSFRTDNRTQNINTAKTSNIGGIADLFNSWFGSSLFLSSRNGLVVASIIQDRNLEPPLGFLVGGIRKSIGMAAGFEDPERWLTSSLGLAVRSVGAIATPIWSGAFADYGPAGALFVGASLGLISVLVCRFIPGSEVWVSIALVFSFYGSYFVSAQFIGATLLMAVCVVISRWGLSGHSSSVKL